MTEWITEAAAMRRLAERNHDGDLRAGAHQYLSAAQAGDVGTKGLYNGVPRLIPIEAWASAIVADDEPLRFLLMWSDGVARPWPFDDLMARRADIEKLCARSRPGPAPAVMPRVLAAMRKMDRTELSRMKIVEMEARFSASHRYVLDARKTVLEE